MSKPDQNQPAMTRAPVEKYQNSAAFQNACSVVAWENRESKVHMVTQHTGNNSRATSQRVRRRSHSTEPAADCAWQASAEMPATT